MFNFDSGQGVQGFEIFAQRVKDLRHEGSGSSLAIFKQPGFGGHVPSKSGRQRVLVLSYVRASPMSVSCS